MKTKEEFILKYRSEIFDCNMDECYGIYQTEAFEMLELYAAQKVAERDEEIRELVNKNTVTFGSVCAVNTATILRLLSTPQPPRIWTNDKVIEFVNWYLKLNRINPRYELENQTVIDSFLNGDPVEVWDNQYTPRKS